MSATEVCVRMKTEPSGFGFNVVFSQIQPFFITIFDARFVFNTENKQHFFLCWSVQCQNTNSVITDIIIAIFGHSGIHK